MSIAYALLAGILATAPPGIHHIDATADRLEIHLAGASEGTWTLVELWPHESPTPALAATRTVWRGNPGKTPVSIPRFDGPRDRLYMKFQLLQEGRPEGDPQYVTGLSGLPARDFPIPWPESKKGLTCPVDLDDVIALGTKYAVVNSPVSMLLDVHNEDPEYTWAVDGEEVPINMPWVRPWLDARIKRMSDAGINITLVCTNLIPQAPDPANPLIHPDSDLANAPAHHGAFNMRDSKGIRYFRAAMEFLADRYTRSDGQYGRISGIVVGNEVQSHWVWYNQGEATVEEIVRDYVVALRIADLAARKTHRGLRVYASLEHHWTKRGYTNNPLKEARGREVLERLARSSRREGDFPWNLAFHPYPDNLFEPRFWKDRIAPLRFDAPKITFKNIEVLPAFMAREEMRYAGKPRRIILSEQGFHTPDGPDGEQVQAAAFAYAYYKVKHLDGIDALMLHRHVSARDEGGLKLGLWTWDPKGKTGFEPGRKKYIWEVFRKADTPEWEEAFAFALPIIGLKTWEDALPATEIDTRPAPVVDASRVVLDCYEDLRRAKVENSLDFRPVEVIRAAGWLAPAIFHHPMDKGVGTATYTVSLPRADQGSRLVFRFDTQLQAKSANGVGFSVLVDGKTVWSVEQVTEAGIAREVELTSWAGKEIRLGLGVDALGNAANDWAVWVQPLVMIEAPGR